MILTHESGSQEDQFDEKKWRQKISWYYHFKKAVDQRTQPRLALDQGKVGRERNWGLWGGVEGAIWTKKGLLLWSFVFLSSYGFITILIFEG